MTGPTTPDADVSVVVLDDQDDVELDPQRWMQLAAAALAAEGVRGPAELGLSFVDEARIAELNREHLGGDGPTDVLAFPIDPEPFEARPTDPVVPVGRLLGDVVVCPAVAARQADAAGHAVADEIALLVVHGVLHVVGHDHAQADEAALMRAREQAILQAHHVGVR